jgi:hypothetical protein
MVKEQRRDLTDHRWSRTVSENFFEIKGKVSWGKGLE